MIDRRSLLVAVAPGAVVTGCGDWPRAAAPPPPPIVKAEPVVQRDVPISAEWVDTSVGHISAQIRPRVSGHLISQNYTEGAVVKTGDLLFQVDPRPYQVALDQAEAQLLQAESQLGQAKAQVSGSQAQVEQALAKVAQGEAEVTQTAADQRRTEFDVLCGPDGPRTGVVSFTLDGLDVALAAAMLDESAGIAVRSGLHCTPAAHRALGAFPTGTVRVSFGHFNPREHADALVATVRDIARSARS